MIKLVFLFRSAVLFYTKEYSLCVKDIEESLNQGYPDHLKYKLFDRKAKSLVQLKKFKDAVWAYEDTIDLL